MHGIAQSASEYHNARMSMLLDEHKAKMDMMCEEQKMKEAEHEQHTDEHRLKMQILHELRAKISASPGDHGEQLQDVAAVLSYL